MSVVKPKIKIPEEGILIPSEVKKRFDKIDQVVFGIMITVVLSTIAIIVSVIGLFLDQMRYNNVAYKDYSQKVQSVSDVQDINQLLLGQNKILLEQNKKNQEVIIEMLK